MKINFTQTYFSAKHQEDDIVVVDEDESLPKVSVFDPY